MKPLTINGGVNKIVACDQSKCSQANWDLRTKCNSNVEVIDVPVLVNQSWEHPGYDVLVVRRNSVKVLPG